jgi:hypothetical protein
MRRTETRRPNAARKTRGRALDAAENRREGDGRALTGAPGLRGAATPAATPVRGEAFDDEIVDVRGAGDTGIATRDVTAVCCVCVDMRDGWVRAEVARGALVAVAVVGVATPVMRATAGVTVLRVVVTRLAAGAFCKREAADAAAVVTTLVTGAEACATSAVVVVTTGTTCATAAAGVVATLETARVTTLGAVLTAALTVLAAVLTVLVTGTAGPVVVAVLTMLVAALTVLVTVPTVLVTGAAGAVSAGALAAVAGAAAAALTVLVAALTVLVTGAAGAMGVAAFVVVTAAGDAGGAGGMVTAFETATAGEVGVATEGVAELMPDVAEATDEAGLGAAAMARFGTTATVASSEVAAMSNRNRLGSSLTSVGMLPRTEET